MADHSYLGNNLNQDKMRTIRNCQLLRVPLMKPILSLILARNLKSPFFELEFVLDSNGNKIDKPRRFGYKFAFRFMQQIMIICLFKLSKSIKAVHLV
ncbi:hypothetical protein BpHYR1_044112 [Brachionus plicatilis]|uniref:Uncharacterized protein n=1 Tax=Brachionus plicatilis TaxID=10195 RepID=A0A3M7Q8V8_BRAPC|nr:hypothetical protein BpHYR1_044112 [Brachionus plicatilis]